LSFFIFISLYYFLFCQLEHNPMNFVDIFVGSEQSKYAAMAIIIALVAIAFTILFSKEKIPLQQKLIFVVVMFLLSLPAMLYSLFQITCLVTGTGFRNNKWWCGAYAWFITLLIFVYAVVIVVMSIVSLTSDQEAKKVEQFYNQQQAYEAFADKEMFEEEKEEEPPVNMVKMPADGEVMPPPPPTEDQMEPSMGGAVEPVVEKFTSCGAAWQM